MEIESAQQSSHANACKFRLKKPYHALVVPMPFQGHIHPLIQFCKRFLIPAGFKVTMANTQVVHQRITATQTHDDELEAMEFVSLEDGFSEELHDDVFGLVAASISSSMEAAVQRVLDGLQPPASCIVSDLRLVFTQDLANAAGIPRMALWPQSATHFASNHLFAQGFQAPPDDSTLISCVYGATPHKRSEVSLVCFDVYPYFNKYTIEPFQRICESMFIVINTFEELESKVLDGLQQKLGVRPLALGPLVNCHSFSILKGINTNLDNIQNIHNWLDKQIPSSVLYIAFGTVVKLSNEQMEELVCALESVKQTLIWVFRPSQLSDNSKAINILERLKSFGIIVPWVPQWQILSHPAIGGFLTHCGWNSTLESISAGVPLLGWPQLADQFLCRRCITDQWEIGLGLDSHESLVSRVELANKVRQLMCEERGNILRKNVRKLSNFAKKALVEGHETYEQFNSLLKIYTS